MRMPSTALPSAEIIVVGAGIIGLSIALELRLWGADVIVIERDKALAHASTAAAGMLAAHDPYNPPPLQQLSEFSLSVYDEFLDIIQSLSGRPIPYQTTETIQYEGSSRNVLTEHSLDPRQLAPALLQAVKASGVELRENSCVPEATDRQIVHTTGAWGERFCVRPRKGQMLRVHLPPDQQLTQVHRAEYIYVVPRTQGPQANTALIGATVEDAGFDLSIWTEDLLELRHAAAELTSELDFLRNTTVVESWAGLRPSTPDNLPIIGRLNERELVATGHFRNGILLAPATAKVMADLVQNRQPAVDLEPYDPDRFAN